MPKQAQSRSRTNKSKAATESDGPVETTLIPASGEEIAAGAGGKKKPGRKKGSTYESWKGDVAVLIERWNDTTKFPTYKSILDSFEADGVPWGSQQGMTSRIRTLREKFVKRYMAKHDVNEEAAQAAVAKRLIQRSQPKNSYSDDDLDALFERAEASAGLEDMPGDVE